MFRVWLSVLGWLCSASAFGTVTNVSSVVDGAGSTMSAGMYTNIHATAQPGGIAVSSGGSFVHYAGFLNTFSLRPTLDTDGDGLVNEFDEDNDNDHLSDAAEILGTEFSPVTSTDVHASDSDGDGTPDGDESIAGTDPTDASSSLVFVNIAKPGNDRILSWQARGNNERTYVLRKSSAPGFPLGQVIFSNTVSGGAAPWFSTVESVIITNEEAVNMFSISTSK